MTREEYEASLYLVHHGIKGQKWGVRRFQNEDGTLTAAGEKRKQKTENKLNTKNREQQFRKASYDATERAMTKGDLKKWARWHYSDAATQQRRYIQREGKKINKLLDKAQRDYDVSYDVSSGMYHLNPKKLEKLQKKSITKDSVENGKKQVSKLLTADNHPANVEASKKYSKGFMDYVKKEAGGFHQIDDPELVTLLELEYEEQTGKKASK